MVQSAPGTWWAFAIGSVTISILVWAFAIMFVRIQRRRLDSDRRQLEELRRREEKYKSIFDSSIAGLVRFVVADRSIIEANKAALIIAGCSSSKELELRFFADHTAWLDELLHDLHAAGSVDQREFEFLRSSGTPSYCLVSARLNTQDRTADLVLVDITEQKRLHQNLLHAHRMEVMGTLAAGIAHDVNNILTPMSLSVEQLELANIQPELRSTIDILTRGVERARAVADQFLTIARGVSLSPSTIHPEALIQDTIRLLTTALPKTIRLEIDAPSRIWTVAADYTQIQQVLMNLCVNARDAMPKGGCLRIAALNIAAQHPEIPMELDRSLSYVVVRVEDTGLGIPQEHLDRIFDPFFTTKPQGTGTGLGLSMCQQILAQHHGAMTVHSKPGAGSVFSFWLVAGAAADKPAGEIQDINILPGGNALLLVIDDEPNILLTVDEMLTAAGYRVLTAQDGEEGIAMFLSESHQISAVVCDLMMPTLAGPDTIRRLRAINPRLPIVAISGIFVQDTAMMESLGRHFTFLRKPFKREQLLKALSVVRQVAQAI